MRAAFLKPRYWPIWLLLACMRFAILLPYGAQLALGRGLGRLLRRAAKRRWRITLVNLERCFPQLDAGARSGLALRHFESLGITLFETAMCWWAHDARLKKLVTMDGLEHLQAARAKGHGVILLSAHFTSLEIGGRFLTLYTDFHVMYRPHQNALLEDVTRRSRERHWDLAIPRNDVRLMLKSLKSGKPVWYAPDQGYRGKNSEMIPFFGIPAPTNTATSRLARMSEAPVVPFFVERLPGTAGYRLYALPALENFPSEDADADALRINRLLEERIRRVPEQYLWSHDRFKVVPRD
ncbi:MAG TPA: LpxL/LpxP family Kdo(2)-lipid IV(A) lauroyl/palmitoleoyl acyltransferase [Gammaproteobacteria bacterium]|nr:LpxL/LpxP family Kdo(2)-lipid IV(A) lauroyl/palmitoleoyl acyltransferase [Gammaproteobacteria bacterium]